MKNLRDTKPLSPVNYERSSSFDCMCTWRKKILKSWKLGDLFLFVYRKLFSNHAEVVGKSLLKN